MTDQESFLVRARDAAKLAGHPWPEFAACEAALESRWGTSQLARKANNLYGQKQSHPPVQGTTTLTMPTHEYIQGKLVMQSAQWAVFPHWAACFAARVALLRRLAPDYPHYKAALAATTGPNFVAFVSQSWSTDVNRSSKVLAVYEQYKGAFSAMELA